MRRLDGAGAGELSDAELTELYAFPAGRVVRANMVASLDGAASLSGASAGLSSAADKKVFALLRTLADVILVGAGTARSEKYAPVRVRELWKHLREGRPPTPPIAVITGSVRFDPNDPLFSAAPAHARTMIITSADAAAVAHPDLSRHAEVIAAGSSAVDLAAGIRALSERGFQRILTEGGPGILSQLAGLGLVDELCLTIGPLLAGPGAFRIVTGAPFASPVPMSLAHVLEDSGSLLCRYVA